MNTISHQSKIKKLRNCKKIKPTRNLFIYFDSQNFSHHFLLLLKTDYLRPPNDKYLTPPTDSSNIRSTASSLFTFKHRLSDMSQS